MEESCKRHRKGDGSHWAYDGHGIPLTRVCSKCEAEKMQSFRPDIKERYDADEPIDGD